MTIKRHGNGTFDVDANGGSGLPDLRRVARLLRRARLAVDLWQRPGDDRSLLGITVEPGGDAPSVHAFETARHSGYWRSDDPSTWITVDPWDVWEATERLGLNVSLAMKGDFDEWSYEAEAWSPHADEFPLVSSEGESREEAMFGLALGVERLTRHWRHSSRCGLPRPALSGGTR